MQNESNNFLIDFVRNNAWAIIIVIASIVAQWAIFSTRLTNDEGRLDRQSSAISTLQSSVNDVQTQYAALNAKLDALNDNVLYIRNRVDKNNPD